MIKVDAVTKDITLNPLDTGGLSISVEDSSGNTVDISEYKFYLTVKINKIDEYKDAVLKKEIIPDNPTSGNVIISLDDTDTDIPTGSYYYDIVKEKSVNGDVVERDTLITAKMIVLDTITGNHNG